METPFEQIKLEDWRSVARRPSSTPPSSAARPACRISSKSGGGTIINIGGLTGHRGATGRAHVIAAKSGLAGFTKALALDLAPAAHHRELRRAGHDREPARPAGRAEAPGAPRCAAADRPAAASRGDRRRWCACCAARTRATSPASRSTSTAADTCRDRKRLAEVYLQCTKEKPCRRRLLEKTEAPCMLDTIAAHGVPGHAFCPAARRSRTRRPAAGRRKPASSAAGFVTTAEQRGARQRHAARTPTRPTTRTRRRLTHPRLRHRAGGAGDGGTRSSATARRCCARSRSATTSAAGSRMSLNAYRVPRGRPFDAQLRPDVRRRGGSGRAGESRDAPGAPPCSRTPPSRRPESRAGCATRSTSRRRSTSAACRRATASRRRRWWRTASPAWRTCSRASATSSSPTGASRSPRSCVAGLGEVYEIMNTNIKRWSVGSPIQAPLDALLGVDP